MLTVEKLPFASRELNMRLLVRTNDPYAGSLNHKNVEFFVDGQSGPFRITSQTEPVAWEIGSEQTITQGSGVTIYNSADGTTGNRTLAGRGMATLIRTGNNEYYISGAGLS